MLYNKWCGLSLQREKKKQDGGTFTVLTLRFRKTRKLQGDSVGLICTPTLLISLVETLTGKRGRHLSACTCTPARRKTLEKHKEELLLTLRDQLNRAWKHGGLKQCPFGNRTICFQAFCLLGSRLDCFNIKNISSKSITIQCLWTNSICAITQTMVCGLAIQSPMPKYMGWHL